MRDRLIELINRGMDKYNKNPPSQFFSNFLADYLLANGVIVPPCEVGDKIYMLVTKHTHSFTYSGGKMQRNENQHTFIKQTYLMESNFFKVIRAFGKTVFLTREEAEKALQRKEGESNVHLVL